jgi:alanine dehydrogenase
LFIDSLSMIIGIPKEIKDGETRVGITPDGVKALAAQGHRVRIETRAGAGAGFSDGDYRAAGAQIVATPVAAFDADIAVKVKEIQSGEWRHLKPGSTLFSFLHLPADAQMARELLARRITGIAFETVTDRHGGLPILAPMSVIAGQLAVLVGANLLTLPAGGNGTLLAGSAIVPPGAVLIVGAGNVGAAAVRLAAAIGASVTVLASSERNLAALRVELGDKIATALASVETISRLAPKADLVIGAVNIRGRLAPKLLLRDAVRAMRPGSVIVDVCIDGGGIAQTSRPTTHAAPTFVAEGVIHYCVPNMPAAVPRSATLALTQAALPYLLALAGKGILRALRDDDTLAAGLQMCNGSITHAVVAQALGLPCAPADAMLHACGMT